MERNLAFGLLLAATGAASTVAVAQQPEQLPQVTIEATRSVKTEGRSASGIPIEVVQLSRKVGYADLDLSSHAGATEFEKRINDTAKAACKQLDTLYPITASADATSACIKGAVEGAMTKAHALIAAADKKGGSAK